jgi:hypothetical protein
MHEATDIVKARGVVAGGLSVDTSKDLRMRLELDMLGVPYKYVTGYRSSSTSRLALQKGEINLTSESPPSYRSVVVPSLVNTGIAIPVFYDAYYGGGAFEPSPQVDGLDLLPFHELYRKIKGVPPSGLLWENYRAITASDGSMQRMIVLPPGTPPAAREALAAAVAAINADKEHAAEAMSTIGFVPDWQTGPDLAATVRRLLTVAPEVRSFLTDYMKAANK